MAEGSRNKKTMIIAAGAAFVLFAGGIAVIFGALFTSKYERAEIFALENFKQYATEYLAEAYGNDICPVLRAMLSDIEITHSRLNDGKDAVDVHFTLPVTSGLSRLGGGAVYDSSAPDLNPGEFISAFKHSYSQLPETQERQQYLVPVPVSFTLLDFEIFLPGDIFIHTAQRYCEDFSRMLEACTAQINLAEALADYVYPGIYPVSVSVGVSERGILNINTERYDSEELFAYLTQSLSEMYGSRFLTEAIETGEIVRDYEAALAQFKAGLREPSLAMPIPVANNKDAYRLDIGSIPPGGRGFNSSDYTETQRFSDLCGTTLIGICEQIGQLPVHTPQDEPQNGVLTGISEGLALTIENTPGFGSYYIVFVSVPADEQTGDTNPGDSSDLYNYLGVYVRDGSMCTVQLPAGTYRIKYASGPGDTWYGTEFLFGPGGRYLESTSTITMSAGSYILTLNTDSDLGDAVGDITVPYGEW